MLNVIIEGLKERRDDRILKAVNKFASRENYMGTNSLLDEINEAYSVFINAAFKVKFESVGGNNEIIK